MRTPALAYESWTIAAYFAIVTLGNNVGSMISYNIEQPNVEAFHLSAFQQLSSFLDHPLNRHSPPSHTDRFGLLGSFFFMKSGFLVLALFAYDL